MKKTKLFFAAVSLMLIISMLCSSFAFVGVSAADATVSLSVNSGNGKVKLEVDGKEAHNGAGTYSADVTKGATVTLTAVVEEGDGILMFWADKYGYTVSKESTYSFTADSDTSITAYFETVGKSTIVYRNNTDARKVLAVVARDANSLLDEHLVASAYKYGHTFKGWDLSVADINAGIKAGKGAIYVDPYYEVSADKCDITVVGGKVNGSTSVSVGMFSDITLIPDNTSTFVAWKDGDGNIISDKAELSVKAFKSETYTAVNDAMTLTPTVTLYLTPDENEIVHARTLVFAPTGTTVVSYGLLYVKNADYTTTDMKVEKVGNDNILQIASYKDPTGVLVNRFVDTDYVVARAYLTYTNGSTTVTVYSDAAEMQSIDDDYWLGADGNGDIFDNDAIVGEKGDDIAADGFSALHAAAGLTGATDSYNSPSGAVIKTYSSVSATTVSNLRQAYLDTGFKLYSTAVMGNINSATYTRDGELAHLYWMNDYSWIKVVTSPREAANLPSAGTGTGAITITQLSGAKGFYSYTSAYAQAKIKAASENGTTNPFPNGATMTSNVAASGNGMGYVIKLADGSFIVYDGGYYADAQEVQSIVGNGTIRAWVITHGHGDHTGAFLEYIYKAKAGDSTYGARIESIIVAPATVNSTDISYDINNAMKGVVNEAINAGIAVCYAHTGMVFDFGNVSMEILYTYEDLYMDKGDPENWHAYYTGTCKADTGFTSSGHSDGNLNGAPNETSLVSRIKVDNGINVMLLADAGHAAADRLVEYYGKGKTSYLKSDYCQMSHHSCESFTVDAYESIAGLDPSDSKSTNSATIWFVPAATTLYNNNVASGGRNYTILTRFKNKIGATTANGKFLLRNGTSTTLTNNPSTNVVTLKKAN